MVEDCPQELVATAPGYRLCQGSTLDRAILLKTMRRTYQELYPQQTFDHLAQTLESYFSSQTPLWWVEALPQTSVTAAHHVKPDTPGSAATAGAEAAINAKARQGLVGRTRPAYVGCLWMGTATDQVSGLRHAHIFLLYVQPEHRRRGLGRSLMHQAEAWAQARGDRQISLQVFEHNAAALSLYQNLGYRPQSIALVKPIEQAS